MSKGSFNLGTGWELQLNDSMFQGKYQMMMEMNNGVNVDRNVTAYLITPGADNRALFVCDTAGFGRWYVNGTASNTQARARGSHGQRARTLISGGARHAT